MENVKGKEGGSEGCVREEGEWSERERRKTKHTDAT